MGIRYYSTPIQYKVEIQNQMNIQEDQIERPIVKDRIYFSMLEKVGTLGRFQILLMVFIFIVGMQASSCFLINPYLFYQQQFDCPSDIKDCKEYVCKLNAELRAPFIPVSEGRVSLANQYGDFRCEGGSFVTLLNSSIILGSVIGIFSAIFFTEWLGRRGTMIVSLVVSIVGLCVTFIESQTAAVIGVFLYGAGLDISYSSVFTFVTEFFAEQHRGRFYNLISLSFAVGTLVNPIAFYFIYDWRWVVLFVFILPIIIAILGFMLVVEDTPIELISYHTAQDTYSAFMRIAKWNRIQNHGLTLEGVREVKQEYDENQRRKHARVFSIVDLVRYDSLRRHLIPLGALKFMMMFIYYAPGLLLDQFAMSIYINGIVNGVSQICGIPLQQFLLRYQRKMSSYLLFSASAAFCMGMWMAKELSGGSGSVIESVLLFLYRMSCTIVSFVVVVMLNETYPAQVRNLAIFFNISLGRSATLLVPFVSSFCGVTHIPFLILLSFVSLLGTFVTCFTVETFGIPPPQMIQQVQIEQHHYKYYRVQQAKQE